MVILRKFGKQDHVDYKLSMYFNPLKYKNCLSDSVYSNFENLDLEVKGITNSTYWHSWRQSCGIIAAVQLVCTIGGSKMGHRSLRDNEG